MKAAVRQFSETPRFGLTPVAGLAVLLCLFVLSACSGVQQRPPSPPPLVHTQEIPTVPDVDLLAVSQQMHDFLDQYVLPYENLDTRLDLLSMAVGRGGVLGFQYEPQLSLTAAEAFAARSGNCVSYANMLVALARAAGLEAEYQEILVQRDWSSVDNTLLLEKHINVVISAGYHQYVMDITRRNPGPKSLRRALGDAEVEALYYNNRGVDALLDGDLPAAYAHTVKAIETAPTTTGAWVNLGVILRRNEQLDDAAFAHRAALNIDPGETAALSNLYDIYLARGEYGRAAEVQQRVEHYRRQNPYYLLHLSERAIAETRYSDSLDLLERALRKKAGDHELHFAMARTRYLLGETEAAEESLRRARELAPGHLLARYRQPLPELIDAGGPGIQP